MMPAGPDTVICKLESGRLVRIKNSNQFIGPPHPLAGVDDLHGLLTKAEGIDPVILTGTMEGILLTTGQG